MKSIVSLAKKTENFLTSYFFGTDILDHYKDAEAFYRESCVVQEDLDMSIRNAKSGKRFHMFLRHAPTAVVAASLGKAVGADDGEMVLYAFAAGAECFRSAHSCYIGSLRRNFEKHKEDFMQTWRKYCKELTLMGDMERKLALGDSEIVGRPNNLTDIVGRELKRLQSEEDKDGEWWENGEDRPYDLF